MSLPQTLDEQVITLLFKLNRQIRKHMCEFEDDNQPTMLQVQAMNVISNEQYTMRKLAQDLGVALPTATALIDRLVKAGHVKRDVDAKDRRVIHVSLTESGKQVLQQTMKQKMEHMKVIIEKIPQEDKISICRIFSNLLNEIETHPLSVANEPQEATNG